MADRPLIPGLTGLPTGGASTVGGRPIPGDIAQFPTGSMLHGSVTGFDTSGRPIITAEGLQMVLQTKVPMKQGSQVVLRMEPSNPQAQGAQVRVLSVDGKSPLNFTPPPSNASQPAVTLPGTLATPATPITGNTGAEGQLASAARATLGTIIEAKTIAPLVDGKAAAPQPNIAPQVREGLPLQTPLPLQQMAFPAAAQPAGQPPTPLLMLHPAATPLQANQQGLPAAITQFLQQGGAMEPGVHLQVRLTQILPPAMPLAGGVALPTTPQQSSNMTTNALNPNAAQSAQAGAATPQTTGAPTRTPVDPAALALYQKASGLPGGNTNTTPNPLLSSATPSPASSPAAAGSANALPNTELQLLGQIMQRASGNVDVIRTWLERTDAQFLQPQQMGGVVMGREQGGALLIQTRFGTVLTPPTGQPPAPGTWVQLNVEGMTKPQAALPQALLPMSELAQSLHVAGKMTSEYSALHELIALMQASSSPLAMNVLQRVVPHIGPQFTAGLLLFMSVLKQGDLSNWIGNDAMEWLEGAGRGDLLPRLGGEFASLRALFSDQPNLPWQAMFFPVMSDQQLHMARLYIRQEEDGNQKQENGGTRFLVEIDLSQLGAMQFDGFIKKRGGSQNAMFDLVVRTLKPLEENLRNDISTIFYQAQEVTGLQGQLVFRLEHEFSINPLKEIQRAKDSNPDAGGSFLA